MMYNRKFIPDNEAGNKPNQPTSQPTLQTHGRARMRKRLDNNQCLHASFAPSSCRLTLLVAAALFKNESCVSYARARKDAAGMF